MNVTFRCPQCDRSVRCRFDQETSALICPVCGWTRPLTHQAVVDGRVIQCLVCSCKELFVRKDFNQRLGIAIIVSGFIASSVAWFYVRPLITYAILFATALVDVLLYVIMGNLLQCYRCHSEYREVAGLEEHGMFRLETHERFRQQAARVKELTDNP
jgi:hypothetical protein